jgi:ElaB/YqjD/DUF883 family membrane-anchored ribosome-binding protein/DNA-binding transcriptional MerR regulator
LNLDSEDEKIESPESFIKPLNIILSINNNKLKKAYFDDMRSMPNISNQKQQIEKNEMPKSEQEIIDAVTEEIQQLEEKVKGIQDATIAKDINARLSKLYNFLKGYKEGTPTVENHGEIIDRSINSIGKMGDSEMTPEELSRIISDAVAQAVQKKDDEIKAIKDTLTTFVDAQAQAKAQKEEESNRAKYLDNIKKFGKHLRLTDAYINEQATETLKIISDSVLNAEPSSTPAKPLQKGKPATPTDGEKPMIELADGTKVEKIEWDHVFDSVSEDFNMATIFVDDDIAFAEETLGE